MKIGMEQVSDSAPKMVPTTTKNEYKLASDAW